MTEVTTAVLSPSPPSIPRKRKTPDGCPPGACSLPGSLRRSWIEVALPAEHRGPDVLVVDDPVDDGGTRAVRRQRRRAFVGGVVVLIEHFHTDIELRHRVPLGAGIGFPEAVVRAAAVAGQRREGGDLSTGCHHTAVRRARTGEPRVDEVGRGPVVGDVDVATADGGPPFRVPDVLVRGKSTPHLGQLDLGAGIEDTVGNPGHAYAVAVLVELERRLVGAHAGRAFGVADVEADHVAAREVEPGTASHRPAVPIFRMAVVDHVRRRIVGRAGIVQRGADADEAPSLIEPQVCDDVRHPEAEVSVIDRQAVVVDDRAVRTEERRVGHVDRAAALAGCGVFQRERAGEAVAELGGIGPEVLAGRAGVTRDPHVVVAVGAAVGEEVEERLRPAHREARKLDERAIPERVEGRATAGGPRRGVLRAEADVAAQRAVFGLLTHVPRDRAAYAVLAVVGAGAGEPALRRHGAGAVADDNTAAAGI